MERRWVNKVYLFDHRAVLSVLGSIRIELEACQAVPEKGCERTHCSLDSTADQS